jgi:hypothetical protein
MNLKKNAHSANQRCKPNCRIGVLVNALLLTYLVTCFVLTPPFLVEHWLFILLIIVPSSISSLIARRKNRSSARCSRIAGQLAPREVAPQIEG